MNIFKKVGAALLAAALMTATAVTASADEQEKGYGIRLSHTDTQNVLMVENLPENVLECDEITLDLLFTTIKKVDGELQYDHTHQYEIMGWIKPGQTGSGYWSVYDTNSKQFLKGEGTGGNMELLKSDGKPAFAVYADLHNKYLDDILANSNAVQIGVMGTKDGKQLWYFPSGDTSDKYACSINMMKDTEEPTTPQEPLKAHIERDEHGVILTVENVSAKYAQCDSVYANVYFTTVRIVNGNLDFSSFNRYSLLARKDKGDIIGAWVIYDSQTGEWQGGNEGGSGMAAYNPDTNIYVIGMDSGNKYYDDSFSDFNAVYVDVYGLINGERVDFEQEYDSNGNRKMSLLTVGDVEIITDTSDTSSEPTSSDTSSEPTSSDTSSEPTSSDTSSEPTSSDTSSEPTSSASVSSGNSDNKPGDNDNPNSGAAMLLIPLAIIGGAAVMVSAKKRK